jgi:hypothetical protein
MPVVVVVVTVVDSQGLMAFDLRLPFEQPVRIQHWWLGEPAWMFVVQLLVVLVQQVLWAQHWE